MKIVEYKIEVTDFYQKGYSKDTKISLTQNLFAKMADGDWIYKEELKISNSEDVHSYLFMKYDQTFLEYNKELLAYIKP